MAKSPSTIRRSIANGRRGHYGRATWLMGIILAAISIQMFLTGIEDFFGM